MKNLLLFDKVSKNNNRKYFRQKIIYFIIGILYKLNISAKQNEKCFYFGPIVGCQKYKFIGVKLPIFFT
jgi:hypothetical protein